MSERLARVEALFHAALERPADERARYLAGAEGDATIRAQVARLLAHHAEDDTLLHDALDAALAATTPTPRERIGAYRVLRELGSGGMGTVFLAERHIGEARQRVALKLIRGFPTADARARLARERTLLAELNHPNIARLLDGGDTDDGQPYLVMEYVEGRALAEHAATLAIDAKLRLAVRLCRAVQHAHQRLVVHRDIKPGNVIVRDDGEPVLLDFGIGKWLADDAGHTATRVFTPAYAAPEQRRGAPATTASDVYGLGCLLCELVADARLPEREADTPIPRPSRLATNATIARRLAGDIDQIVQKAAHADPDRRYASADALAADIERHLAGRPIAAAPDRFAYRASKYFVRHRAAVIAGVAAVAIALVFVWRLAVERTHALDEARRAETTRDFLLSLFNAATPGDSAERGAGARALIELGRRRVEAGLPEQPVLRAEVLATLGQLYVSLGDPAAALGVLEPARVALDERDVEARRALADVEEALGRAYRDLDRVDDSRHALAHALALREPDAATRPAPLARSLHLVGRDAHERGHASEAQPLLLRALDLREKLEPRDPVAVAETRRVLALVDLDLGDPAKAAREAADVETELRAVLPPRHAGLVDALATHAAILNRRGAFDAARAKLEEALSIARESVGEDSIITANLENALAESLLGLGRFRESVAHSETAYAIQRRVRADPVAGAIAGADLGVAFATIGAYARAQALLGDAIAALSIARPADDPELLRARSNLARVQSLAGDHDAALAALDDVLARTRAARGEKSERYGFEMMRRAAAEVRAAHYEEAEAWIARVEPLFVAMLPPQHPWRADLHNQRGRIALGRDDADTAEREFAAALATLGAQPGLAYDMRIIAGVGHAEALERLGRADDARVEMENLRPSIEAELLPAAAERVRFDRIAERLASAR